MKILVAEDNEVNQKLISFLLKKLGIDFTIVENGKLAVQYATAEQYDYILMDLYMPEMDGFDAARIILNSPQITPKPVIIALTGNSESDEQARCISAGMKGFITKPLKAEDLQRILV